MEEIIVRKRKSPAKTLKVKIEGKVIAGSKATEIFVSAIKRIGPEKIAESTNFKVDGLPFIVKERDNRKQMNFLGNDWYVCTHMSTNAKKLFLSRIACSLNIRMSVELVTPE